MVAEKNGIPIKSLWIILGKKHVETMKCIWKEQEYGL